MRYHVSVHVLTQRVLEHVRRRELLHAGDRVGLAVSGGADSVAMLRLLLALRSELGIVLSVVHFNHKLRGAESDADQEFVAALAHEHGLEFYVDCADVAARAAEMHISVEAAAREARYEFFGRLLVWEAEAPGVREPEAGSRLDKIATGHTLDDQAETVLMRLIRGTGIGGLGGIYPRIVVERGNDEHPGEGPGEVIRPLLEVRRSALEKYLREINQPWRDDSTNFDATFTRNRVRQIVLPLLEREFNPVVAETTSELAEIARGEQDYWENESSGWMGTVVHWSRPKWAAQLDRARALVQIPTSQHPLPQGLSSESEEHRFQKAPAIADASVNRIWLLAEPLAVQRRLIKAVGEHAGIPLEFRHVEGILRFAAEHGPSGKSLSLPRGWKVVRENEALIFCAPAPRHPGIATDYEYPLPVPGRAVLPEAGIMIVALRIAPESRGPEYNPQQLLQPELLLERLTVRNWHPGDRFWPAHTKAPRKIKELLQERHVPPPERTLWPVAVCGDEIVWVRGFPVPARLRAQPERDAIFIRETPLEEE